MVFVFTFWSLKGNLNLRQHSPVLCWERLQITYLLHGVTNLVAFVNLETGGEDEKKKLLKTTQIH